MSPLHEQLTGLIEPLVESLDCQLWGIHIQGNATLLRVYIDKVDGVGVEDCERISKQLSSTLDVEEVFTNPYTLEVSSPGLDRPLYKLEQYQLYIGATIALSLRLSFEGRKKFQGILTAIEDSQIVLRMDNEEYIFPLENIHGARIVPFVKQ